jgi:hypothetical protein
VKKRDVIVTLMNLNALVLDVHGILKATIVTRKVVGNTQIRAHVVMLIAVGQVMVIVMKSAVGSSIKNQRVIKQT